MYEFYSPEVDIVQIYTLYFRSILEFNSCVWHFNITQWGTLVLALPTEERLPHPVLRNVNSELLPVQVLTPVWVIAILYHC